MAKRRKAKDPDPAEETPGKNCFCKKETEDGVTIWSCYNLTAGGAVRVATYTTEEKCRENCKC